MPAVPVGSLWEEEGCLEAWVDPEGQQEVLGALVGVSSEELLSRVSFAAAGCSVYNGLRIVSTVWELRWGGHQDSGRGSPASGRWLLL